MNDYGNDDWPAQPPMSALIDSVSHADLFDLCGALPDQSVDMILCDLPYGYTEEKWDQIIPFDQMWRAFNRIVKLSGAMVFTASGLFAHELAVSNKQMFRYEWVWVKSNVSGMMNARYMPMRNHESILVFSKTRVRGNQFTSNSMAYYPQGVTETYREENNKLNRQSAINHNRGKKRDDIHVTSETGFPKTTLFFNSERGLHPTQKPVDLFRYLVRTYTLPSELVLDPTCGSGTTAIAAREEGRRFIVGDSSSEYVEVARNRLAQPYTPSFMPQLESA